MALVQCVSQFYCCMCNIICIQILPLQESENMMPHTMLKSSQGKLWSISSPCSAFLHISLLIYFDNNQICLSNYNNGYWTYDVRNYVTYLWNSTISIQSFRTRNMRYEKNLDKPLCVKAKVMLWYMKLSVWNWILMVIVFPILKLQIIHILYRSIQTLSQSTHWKQIPDKIYFVSNIQ